MRSVNAPRIAHDATVEIGEGHRARAINLSTGGIFIAADESLDPGAQVHLKVNLRDGAQDEEIVRIIRDAVWAKWEGHKISHPDFERPTRSMSMIGG